MHVRFDAVFDCVGGVLVLVGTIPLAIAVSRPPRSPRWRRQFPPLWADADLAAPCKRRKLVLYIVGLTVFGAQALLRGLLQLAFATVPDLVDWLLLLPLGISVVCILAALVIHPRMG